MTRTQLPDGPRTAWSQLFAMRDPFPLFRALARDYSDPLTTPILGGDPMVLTWDPEGVEAVFSADPDTFLPGANEAIALLVGQGSMFMLSGAKHRRARKLLMPPFHGQRMRAYGEVIRRAALRWADTWKPGARFTMLATAQEITLDVILEAIFGVEEQDALLELRRDVLHAVESFSPLITFAMFRHEFGGIGPWARFTRNVAAMRAKMEALIAQKRARPGEDVLSLLVAARDEEGQPLTAVEIVEQLTTFVIAGHETTATTLAWAFDLLHRHPEVLARVREEIRALGPAPSPEQIVTLPLLGAVCQETMRLRGPVPMVPRKLARELVVKGFTLPPGTTVAVAVYLAHHHPATYPDPDAFRPDRFLERTYSPFEFLAFGGGARRCLGAAFATYELEIVLATLLGVGRFRLDEKKPVRNVFRIATFGPETGIRMTLEERTPLG